jgi:peptide deformylase
LHLPVSTKKQNVLRILEHPHPGLSGVSEEIVYVDDTVASLITDMISTLQYRTLVDFFTVRSIPRGLAAPQVGISKRLILCGLHGSLKGMINHEIIERKETYVDNDDCISVKEESKMYIKRSNHVTVKYKTPENEEKLLVVRNDAAALLEHEIDHLNGVLNIDYGENSPPIK